MAKTMSPSEKTMTDGQIERAVDIFRAILRKQGKIFSHDAFQKVLGASDLAPGLFAVMRERVEMVSDMITRIAHIDRDVSPREALVATGRNQYLNDKIVATIPDFVGGETSVTFFKIDKNVNNEEALAEYAKRGLKPAHPSAVAKVNQDDPAFADDHPNATIWDGSSYTTFGRWLGERDVRVGRYGLGWGDDWWFAGVLAN